MKQFTKRMTAIAIALLLSCLTLLQPEMVLGTNGGELLELQQFLLGIQTSNDSLMLDYTGDGVVDGFDLAKYRQTLQAAERETTDTGDDYIGFIQTDGTLLTDEAGQQYVIKGMAFGNDVWSNPSTPSTTDHTAESYQELAEMGFNSVRFYLNYALFESDSDPYTYLESGFEWLDQNIAWAKEAGIRLVLNMHYPQGGYQSQGDGTALWTDPENQERLCALWTEIAKRYADEPTILGYGLVNEPVVAAESGTEALELWQSVAQTITDSIRTVDTNHMIFVERMCAWQTSDGTSEQWLNYNEENNYVHITDENVVYEFHYYDPNAFTHQGLSWAGTAGTSVTYPDESYVLVSGNTTWLTGTFSGDVADVSSDEWQYLESSLITPSSDETQMITLVFQALNTGNYGVAYADELKLVEYDENGDYVQTIYAEDFDESSSLTYWSNDGSGSSYYTSAIGHVSSGCLVINGTTDDASASTVYLKTTAGHSYQASGYFKVSGCSSDTVVRPRVDVWDVDSIQVLNREYLEETFAINIAFSAEYDVPVYCGEFGADYCCFEEDRGGDRWLADVLDIFSDADISFNYHAYHDGSFGLYTATGTPSVENRNETLYEIFCNLLRDDN